MLQRFIAMVRHPAFSAVACLLVLAGCSEVLEPPGSSVRIRSFVAERVSGTDSTFLLIWRVEGLEGGALVLTPGPNGEDVADVTELTENGDGQVEVEPARTTTYTLTATSGTEPPSSTTATVTVSVSVSDGPAITKFVSDLPEVNPGVDVVLRWSVKNHEALRLEGPGLGATGVDVFGRTEYTVTPTEGADYTLVASNDADTVRQTLTDVGRVVPAVGLLIAGQSNAQGKNLNPEDAYTYITADDDVRMLGNDYVWKGAYEPTDDCSGQVDTISLDPKEGCVGMGNSGVSFGVSAGNQIHEATGGTVFLVPAAKGGSATYDWLPESDRYDRETLFGSAAHRATLSRRERGAPLGHRWNGRAYGAVLWYQGESDTNTLAEAEMYRSRTSTIFGAFRNELDAPIVFAQLGRIYERSGEDDRNLLVQIVRDAQLQLESSSNERYMVVTHDLPMADRIHLSASGQVELGRRMALAVREHLLDESGVDGTGPRVVAIVMVDSDTIRIDFDRAVTAPASPGPNAYSGYFAVFSGDAKLAIDTIVHGPAVGASAASIVIELGEIAPADVSVRYLPPELPTESGVGGVVRDVVRAAGCNHPMPGTADVCLPLPAFGTASEVALETLRFMDIEPR